jgi:histidine triad (HIT) family protein
MTSSDMSSHVSSYDPQNIFARILRGEMSCHKVYETDAVLAFMDIMPRGEGHCLVIPKSPARNLLDASPQQLADVAQATQIVARAAMQAFGADGITIQQFNEPAGGQVVFHLHVHVIPRFDGVALKPHTGQMADPASLAAQAAKIAASIGA